MSLIRHWDAGTNSGGVSAGFLQFSLPGPIFILLLLFKWGEYAERTPLSSGFQLSLAGGDFRQVIRGKEVWQSIYTLDSNPPGLQMVGCIPHWTWLSGSPQLCLRVPVIITPSACPPSGSPLWLSLGHCIVPYCTFIKLSFHCVLLSHVQLFVSQIGLSVHGILQARTLEWAAMLSCRGSSQPRDWTHVSCISCIDRQILYHSATWEAPI